MGRGLERTRFNEEVMADAERVLCDRLGPTAPRLGFHLVGGTAVAIHLGQRRSVDLELMISPVSPLVCKMMYVRSER
jgi:hypothetical protein